MKVNNATCYTLINNNKINFSGKKSSFHDNAERTKTTNLMHLAIMNIALATAAMTISGCQNMNNSIRFKPQQTFQENSIPLNVEIKPSRYNSFELCLPAIPEGESEDDFIESTVATIYSGEAFSQLKERGVVVYSRRRLNREGNPQTPETYRIVGPLEEDPLTLKGKPFIPIYGLPTKMYREVEIIKHGSNNEPQDDPFGAPEPIEDNFQDLSELGIYPTSQYNAPKPKYNRPERAPQYQQQLQRPVWSPYPDDAPTVQQVPQHQQETLQRPVWSPYPDDAPTQQQMPQHRQETPQNPPRTPYRENIAPQQPKENGIPNTLPVPTTPPRYVDPKDLPPGSITV